MRSLEESIHYLAQLRLVLLLCFSQTVHYFQHFTNSFSHDVQWSLQWRQKICQQSPLKNKIKIPSIPTLKHQPSNNTTSTHFSFVGLYLQLLFFGTCKMQAPTFMRSFSYWLSYLKGIVRQKLRWTTSGINRQVLLQCQDAGYYYFFDLKGDQIKLCKKTFCRHLSLNYWQCMKELVKH